MLRYIFRRLLGAIPTLLVIITLAFFLIRLAPGGPFDSGRRGADGNSAVDAGVPRRIFGGDIVVLELFGGWAV